MDISRYLKIGLRWWWLILLSVALSAAGSYVYSQRQPRIYAAKASLLVGTSVIQTRNPDESLLGLSRTLAQVYGEMAQRSVITEAVIERLGLDMSADQLSSMINTNVIPSAQLLEVFVLDIHPQRAQILANAVAEELILQSPTNVQGQEEREKFINAQLKELQAKIEGANSKIRQLEEDMERMTSALEIADAQSKVSSLETLKTDYQNSYNQFLSNLSESSPNRLTIFESASTPTSPISPNVKLNVSVAAAAGLALAVTAIVLLEFFDDRVVWRREEPEFAPGVPVLGAVHKVPGGADKLVALDGSWSPEADALRNLRSSIFLVTSNQKVSTLLVTSASPGDGKSYVAANLAVTVASPSTSVAAVLASVGTKVILIDADLRKPSLHEVFDIPNLLGLADVLAMPEVAIEAVLKKALRPTNTENLFMLPAGRTPLDPGSLLSSPGFSKALHILSNQADLVIIDSAPILETIETRAVANVVDNVLLVVASGQTSNKIARKAIDYFRGLPNNNLLGVIYNGVKQSVGYNYYAAYGQSPELPERETTSDGSGWRSALWPFGRSQGDQSMILTLTEVANQLGVSEETAERWCEQGRIPAAKNGRRWSVRLEDLNEFIAIYQLGSSNQEQNLSEGVTAKVDKDLNTTNGSPSY